MEAKDLRIGNIVFLDGIPNKLDLSQIMNFAFWKRAEKDYYPQRWLPIPLTDQFFIDNYFKKVEHPDENPIVPIVTSFRYVLHNVIIDRYVDFNTKEVVFEFRFRSYEQGSYLAIVLKSVHQLQNLYFALTGAELVINLPIVKIS